MKAWYIDSPGPIESGQFGELERPSAKAGELLVRVHAVALNPVDYKVTANGNPAWHYPHVPGVDLAGTVEQAAPDTGFQIGDRVAVHTDLARDGAFAEYAVVDARAAGRMPDAVSFEEAASILCAGMTAYQAVIQELNTTDKETILIHAGAGGVGGFAIQLAKRLGLRVATTASAANHDYVKQLGADLAIDYSKEDVTGRVREWTDGRGVDLILNTVGRDEATADLGRLAFSGQLAFIAGGPDTSVVKPFTLAPSIHEVALGAAHASKDETAIRNLARMAERLMELVADDELDPLIAEVLPAERLAEGLKQVQGRHVRGKLIVTF